MKTVGKSLIMSLLLTLGITAFLNMESAKSTSEKVDAIAVAAGEIPLDDPTSPDPLMHCYRVASSDQLDIKTRMDFEARTSAGWVSVDDAGGNLCLKESPAAVEKRLADQAE